MHQAERWPGYFLEAKVLNSGGKFGGWALARDFDGWRIDWQAGERRLNDG
jgi:hypothetical protein